MNAVRILVVEDEAVVAADLVARLTRLGYQVVGNTGDGEKAIALAESCQPDVILMDIRLAGAIDGITAATRIQEITDVAIIFLTAHSDHNTLARARSSEPFGYLLKPFEERELLTQVEIAVHKHRAEQALKESEALYRSLAEAMPQIVFICRADGTADFVNSQWVDYTGLPIEKSLNLDWATLLHPDDSQTTLAKWKEAVQTGQPYETEYRYKRRDGEYRWHLVRATPMQDRRGSITRWIGTATDIHDRKQAETALRENEERIRALIETALDCIITIDEIGIITTCNSATTRVFGYACEEMLGRNISMLMPAPHKNEHDGYLENLKKTSLKKIIGGWREVTGQRKNGTTFLLELAVSETRAGGRQFYTGILRDITARKEAEDDIRRLLREAEQREHLLREKQAQLVQAAKLASLGELATGIAHELNNPLNNINLCIGNAIDLLEKTEPDALKASASLQIAAREVKRGAVIVNQVRAFARMDQSPRVPISVNEILESALTLVREQFRICEIELILTLTPETPWVSGNAFHLEQVILNLLTNAKDAVMRSPLKRVNVASAVQNGFVDITVGDTGCGMSLDHQTRIFDPFFTTKEVGHGTGLGLSISYGIIRDHEGTITVTSETQQGSTFTIRLPTLASPKASLAPEEASSTIETGLGPTK